MKKNILSFLSASIFITSSVLAAETSKDFIPANGVRYTLHPKNLPDHFVNEVTSIDSPSGKYVQISSYENPGDDAYWKIKPAKEPGYFRLVNTSRPNSFITEVTSKPQGDKFYAQICWYTDPAPGDDALWEIKPNKNGKFYRLIPKFRPQYFLTYSDEASPSGKYVQIVPNGAYEGESGRDYFKLVPHDYTLKAVISNFSFGEDFESKLKASAKPDYSSVQTVIVKNEDLGVKIGGTYTRTIQETFAWALNEKLGISVQTSFKTGVPFIAEGKITLGTTFEFSSSQTWTTSNSKTFSAVAEMSPKNPGTYRIGNIVYVASDVEFPFTAKSKLTAKRQDQVLPAKDVEALFKYEGLKGAITKRGPNSITVAVRGKLKATYGVYQETIAEKLDK